MLLIIGISEGNHFYNTGAVDVKILVAGGIATGLLALASNIPGVAPVAAAIAWVGVVASLVVTPGAQSPSPASNLSKIIGGLLWAVWTASPRLPLRSPQWP
jgi:hypothetical protein